VTTSTELVPADVDARTEEIERQVAQARAQAEAMHIRNPEEADLAGQLLRQIKARRSAAEKDRKELKAPILEAGRLIDQKFNEAMAQFDAVDPIVRKKLTVYTDEQDRIRREEEARLEAERLERERKAREAREAQEAEARAKREAAEKEAREAEELRQQAKDEADREAADKLAEEAREAAAEAQTAESAIASLPEVSLPSAVVPAAPKPQGISTRMVWKHRIVDASAVPRDYLMIDEKGIRGAIREGIREIPGVVIEQVPEMAVRA
jgi:predicted acyl esterase